MKICPTVTSTKERSFARQHLAEVMICEIVMVHLLTLSATDLTLFAASVAVLYRDQAQISKISQDEC